MIAIKRSSLVSLVRQKMNDVPNPYGYHGPAHLQGQPVPSVSYAHDGPPPAPPQKSYLGWILGLTLGGLVVMGLCCGGTMVGLIALVSFAQDRVIGQEIASNPVTMDDYLHRANVGGAEDLFQLDAVPVPSFSEPIDNRDENSPSGVIVYVSAKDDQADKWYPGVGDEYRIHIPPGDHAVGSCPCLFVAPAGTTLLTGQYFGEEEYTDETAPYVQAGFVVVQYPLDGSIDPDLIDATDLNEDYHDFFTSGAGLVNLRNAIAMVKQRFPIVDPKRLVVAGHSSAGTHALLAASHLPELAAVVAYAPVTDAENWLSEFDGSYGRHLEDWQHFKSRTSPMTFADRVRVPIFLFHSQDDSVVNKADIERYVMRVGTESGTQIEYHVVRSGNHYQSMIDQGIPAAISWLRNRGITP